MSSPAKRIRLVGGTVGRAPLGRAAKATDFRTQADKERERRDQGLREGGDHRAEEA